MWRNGWGLDGGWREWREIDGGRKEVDLGTQCYFDWFLVGSRVRSLNEFKITNFLSHPLVIILDIYRSYRLVPLRRGGWVLTVPVLEPRADVRNLVANICCLSPNIGGLDSERWLGSMEPVGTPEFLNYYEKKFQDVLKPHKKHEQ